MLDWVALYVTEINSLIHKGRGEKCEIVAADGEETMIVVRRCGKNHADALRKCIRHGMTQLKLPEAPRLRASVANQK